MMLMLEEESIPMLGVPIWRNSINEKLTNAYNRQDVLEKLVCLVMSNKVKNFV